MIRNSVLSLPRFLSTLTSRSNRSVPSLRIPWTFDQNQFKAKSLLKPSGNAVYDTQITNEFGLKVASERVPGGFSTLGVAIDAGSRYEAGYPQGITHFLTKLAFGPSENYPTRQAILSVLEESGAIFDCQASHDVILYGISCRTDCVDRMLDLLGDCIFRPIINEDQIACARESVTGELDDLEMRPDPTSILNEIIHQAAFDETLGNSQYCSRSNLNEISPEDFRRYTGELYRKERMAICCVGNVDHEDFARKVSQHFLSKEEQGSSCPSDGFVEAKWQGESIMIEKDLSDVSLGPTPMPELLHLTIGLKAPSFRDPAFVTACVLQSLMGGGGSFSSGGPGKGMYSRLYQRVLNNFGWMHTAVCTNSAYKDIGLFYLQTSCIPTYAKHMSDVATRELLAVSEKVEGEELQRAKNQLKSSILMNLEQRPVAFEDIVRQVLGMGKRRNPVEFSEMIDNVTDKDIRNLVCDMLSHPPAIAALGSIKLLPDPQYFRSKLTSSRFLRRIFK